MKIKVNDNLVDALIDMGSSDSFICNKLVDKLCLIIEQTESTVSMAESSVKINVIGLVTVDMQLQGNKYNTKLSVLQNLCTDVINGHDILCQNEYLKVEFGGTKPLLSICALTTLAIPSPPLFKNIVANCKPIATKSRRCNMPDRKFIGSEVIRLLEIEIIEPSTSPWRAEVVITNDERHKKRMVIDYSQTVNRFTQLDDTPLPRIDDQINEIAKNNVFSAIDLKDAYYQIPLHDNDKQFTAFEAAGKLYQYKRMPFGVTNGMACFQRVMNTFISESNLSGTFAYLDNITVCGKDQEEHDTNLEEFLVAAETNNLTFNNNKCTFSTTSIRLLGYEITNNTIQPDPSRLQPLHDIPPPQNLVFQKKVIGLFSYYSK